MKPNVFLIDPALGVEDRLTAQWHYVLNTVPTIGQKFVDHICDRSGISKVRFLGTIDHPTGDRDNHPDLLLRCDGQDLLFEHKVDSPLGPQQLERYLALAIQRGWKLSLLSAHRLEIPTSVSESPSFVCPRDAKTPRHFLWQEVHELVANSEAHLAREFKECLEFWGLGRWNWVGIGNPFTDEAAAEELRSMYDSIASMFTRKGASCRKRANSLTYEIRRPFPPIYLLNLFPLDSVAQWDKRLWGPVMALSVWVRRDRNLKERVLPSGKGYIRGSAPRIYVTDSALAPVYADRVFLEREYYVPLDHVLCESRVAAETRLLDFVKTAVDHLQGKRQLQIEDP